MYRDINAELKDQKKKHLVQKYVQWEEDNLRQIQ